MKNRTLKSRVALIIFILVIVLDQASKALANYFGFEISLNKGISLSLIDFLPPIVMTSLLILLTMIIFYLLRKEWLKCPMATGLFFGGALSNILDRVIHGGVRDWLPVPFFNLHNNLADWFIFAGLGLLTVFSLKRQD